MFGIGAAIFASCRWALPFRSAPMRPTVAMKIVPIQSGVVNGSAALRAVRYNREKSISNHVQLKLRHYLSYRFLDHVPAAG